MLFVKAISNLFVYSSASERGYLFLELSPLELHRSIVRFQ